MDRSSRAVSRFPDLPRRCATPLARSRNPRPTVFGLGDPARLFRSSVLRVSKVRSIAATLYIVGARGFQKDAGRMPGTKKKKKLPRAKSPTELVEECVRKIASPKEREAFRDFVQSLLDKNALPADLLDVFQRAPAVGKARFDQFYDACMFLAFPEYRPMVKERAFGPTASQDLRFWRALFPKALGLSHVVLRATSYQEAFAFACDYACRLSLREHKRIPTDMTIRVIFMSDKSASRMLDIRHAVRDATRKASNLKGRKYSSKDIMGARIVAIGRKEGKNFSIFKYAERGDLKRIMSQRAEMRTSAVDIETFRPKEGRSPYDEA